MAITPLRMLLTMCLKKRSSGAAVERGTTRLTGGGAARRPARTSERWGISGMSARRYAFQLCSSGGKGYARAALGREVKLAPKSSCWEGVRNRDYNKSVIE